MKFIYTKTPPTQAGFYWLKTRMGGNEELIRQVYKQRDRFSCGGRDVKDWKDTQWAGPIPYPEGSTETKVPEVDPFA